MAWTCLMYHDVVHRPLVRGGGPERFSVDVGSFERMLDTMIEAGYVGRSLASALEGGASNCVGITFDDGTSGQFIHAVPALRARDMTATFFVTVDWIGLPGFMSWDQLAQITRWGMSVQSHTRSHPFLSELGREDLEAELTESKRLLDERLDQDTSEIALPGGDAPRGRLQHILGDSGYRVVASSRWGVNRDPSDAADVGVRWIKRCTVPPTLSTDLARRIVEGDRSLAAVRIPREAALNGLRALVGASRYARLRRRALDRFADGRTER